VASPATARSASPAKLRSASRTAPRRNGRRTPSPATLRAGRRTPLPAARRGEKRAIERERDEDEDRKQIGEKVEEAKKIRFIGSDVQWVTCFFYILFSLFSVFYMRYS